MPIKPPSGLPPSGISPPSQPAEGAKKSTAVSSTPTTVNPEAVAKALKDYQKMQKNLKKPFISGAAGLFTDNVVFPADLLDPSNPANDPKYLHLYSAVLNLKELARFFAVNEQREEMEEEEEQEEEPEK